MATKSAMASPRIRFIRQVVVGQWFMVFASFFIMAASGATYIFGIYSPSIKSALGYTQQDLNTLSFFKDLGANVGVLSGLINEVTPPWVILFMGVVMNFGGYFMIYLAVIKKISPPLWQMCLYICLGANSQSFANTGALVTCVKNFPESRGVVLGLLKGFVGLSGAIFNQLYYAIYGNDPDSLILLIAWLPAVISIVFLSTIRIMKNVKRQPGELKVFYAFLYIALALAGYLMVLIVVQKQVPFSPSAFRGGAAVVVLMLFVPLVIVIREELANLKQTPLPSSNHMNTATQLPEQPKHVQLLPPEGAAGGKLEAERPTGCFENIFRPPDRGEDYTILQALFSVDMLILFIATICGVGGTLTAIDNMGQIGQSLGYPKLSIGTFVSLISIWNFLGRVTAGFLSEILLAKYKFPRPLMLCFVLLLSCVGHLLIAFPTPGSLYISSIIIGLCFGAQWPLLFAIISELFGLKYYSTLYNFGGVASPIGSYILNVRVAGSLYDAEALKMKGKAASGELVCIGPQCFRLSFIIITAATFFGFLVCIILVLRTRKFYRSDIYARFRNVRDGLSSNNNPDQKQKELVVAGDQEAVISVNGGSTAVVKEKEMMIANSSKE